MSDTLDRVPWSEDEVEFVTELIALKFNEHREIYDRFWKRFRTQRTGKSIYAKCKYLRDRGEPSKF